MNWTEFAIHMHTHGVNVDRLIPSGNIECGTVIGNRRFSVRYMGEEWEGLEEIADDFLAMVKTLNGERGE